MAFGFAAASRSLWITRVLALLFILIYAPTIYGEEQFLRSAFPAFESYAQARPSFAAQAYAGADLRGW